MGAKEFRFASFSLDAANARLRRHGTLVPISPKDFAVLHYLVAHRGRVVPHAELLRAVWRGTSVTPDVLKVRIARLRRLLGDTADAPRFIQNVHGEGYRFIQSTAGPLTAAAVSSGSDGLEPSPLPDSPSPPNPFIGREGELSRLGRLLADAATGHRGMVFVTGEAGIGKTSLVDRFLADAERDPRVWATRGHCIEQYGGGEPYLPVMEALTCLARAYDRARVKAVLRRHAPSWLWQLPALLDAREREALQRQMLGPNRERILRELADALEVLTTEGPGGGRALVILALEDLHWADSSTLELLSLLARRRDASRLLIVGTSRPVEEVSADHPLRSVVRELRAHETAVELSLPRLTPADVAAYLEARFPSNTFEPSVVRELHQRTDGNPLFLADVVRDLLTQQVIARSDGHWDFAGDASAIRGLMPASIRQLVARQRDRLSADDQRLLEAASVAGLEFSTATLAAALDADADSVEERCVRLAEGARFLRVTGTDEWPDGTCAPRCRFLHSLHQELWYERVGPGRRRHWHQRIGAAREAAYGARAHEIASELAVHFEQGRVYGQAVRYREMASRNALQRAANAEAYEHVRQAFALLAKLPPTAERLPQELGLQLGLGTVLAMSEGYSSEAAAGAFRRAHDICGELGGMGDLFQPVFGLSRFFWMRGDLSTARELGAELVRMAQRSGDPVQTMAAHTALGSVLLHAGDLTAAVASLEEALVLVPSHWNDSLLPVYGTDFRLACMGGAAGALYLLGEVDRSARHAAATLAMRSRGDHPLTRGMAAWGLAMWHWIRGEARQTLDAAEHLSRISSRHAMLEFAPFCDLFAGWGAVLEGKPAEELRRVTRGAEALARVGARLYEPQVLGLLAESQGKTGQPDAALQTLDAASAAVEYQGHSWYEAELHRLRGELMLGAPAEAERCLRLAIDVAGRQQARMLELRATLGLARLWRSQDRGREAHDVVAELCDWFPDATDAPDVVQARRFLAATA